MLLLVAMHIRRHLVVSFLLIITCFSNFQLLIADDKQDKQKVAAEVRSMVKRLATVKGAGLEKLSQRFVELDGAGIPVKRAVCEVIGNQSGMAVQNALTVLEKLSPSAAQSAQSLVASADVGTVKAAFEYYLAAFTNLDQEKELDTSLAPVIVGRLFGLAALASQPRPGTLGDGLELQRNVFEKGVKVLSRLAQDDDEALGDQLRLVMLGKGSISLKAPESELRHFAMISLGIATGKDAKRAKLVVPVLVSLLRGALAAPNEPQGGVGAALSQGAALVLAGDALNALGQLGPNAASAAPLVRQLANDSRFSVQAQSVLKQIGG